MLWFDFAQVFQKYMGTGLLVIWFLVALIYLFVHEKRKPVRILFIYLPIVVLLLFFNPLFGGIFTRLVGNEIYFRLCWLLPMSVVIAFGLVNIYRQLRGRTRVIFGTVMIFLILISGHLVYVNPLFTRAETIYHVPKKVVRICDAIKIEGREVMAAFPEEFLVYVRQYSPLICMPYGREVLMGVYDEMNVAMQAEELKVADLVYMAKERGCHYLIIAEDKETRGSFLDYGYELFDTIEGYNIYIDKTQNFSTVMPGEEEPEAGDGPAA